MDELIALAEALEKKAFRGPTMEAVHLHTIEWKAATALRAFAEREKELVEALKEIALLSNNNRANKKMLGDKARAILAKLKEQK